VSSISEASVSSIDTLAPVSMQWPCRARRGPGESSTACGWSGAGGLRYRVGALVRGARVGSCGAAARIAAPCGVDAGLLLYGPFARRLTWYACR
jgi:hypothetical protein